MFLFLLRMLVSHVEQSWWFSVIFQTNYSHHRLFKPRRWVKLNNYTIHLSHDQFNIIFVSTGDDKWPDIRELICHALRGHSVYNQEDLIGSLCCRVIKDMVVTGTDYTSLPSQKVPLQTPSHTGFCGSASLIHLPVCLSHFMSVCLGINLSIYCIHLSIYSCICIIMCR